MILVQINGMLDAVADGDADGLVPGRTSMFVEYDDLPIYHTLMHWRHQFHPAWESWCPRSWLT